jgi:hypothetical protein
MAHLMAEPPEFVDDVGHEYLSLQGNRTVTARESSEKIKKESEPQRRKGREDNLLDLLGVLRVLAVCFILTAI